MGSPAPQRGRCARAALSTIALLAASAPAQPLQPPPLLTPSPPQPPAASLSQDITRPAAARRLVSEFTFDGPEAFAIPRHWDLAQDGSELTGPRPGYPRWNKAELDTAAAFRGRGSVRLTTSGGSVCLRLQPGVVPVFPDAEYLISAKVRTRGLDHSRAALTARYLDKTNRPIPGAESRSELVGGGEPVGQASRVPAPGTAAPAETNQAWTTLTAPLPSGIREAAYIQIDLEILQPERYEPAELGRHQVWPQDYSAVAWFDDVAVVQLPRVRITTGAPCNIIERPARPSVSILIRDLTGESMTGELILQDSRGRTVDRATRRLDSGLSTWEWTPALTELGWYRATLELHAGERRVGSTRVDLVWIDAPAARPTGPPASRETDRFAVILSDLPPSHRALLPDLVRLCGAGAVTLPVWTADLKAGQTISLAQDLVPVIDALKSDWRRITFSFPLVPSELAAAAHVEPNQPLALFAANPKLWSPYLDPLLDKFGQSVQRWQVGNPGSATDPQNLGAAFTSLHGALSRLVPGPVVAIPWPAELTPPASVAADARINLLAALPGSMPAEGLSSLAEAWSREDSAGASVTLVLQPLPNSEFSRYDAAVALVKQAVSLWGEAAPGPVGQASHSVPGRTARSAPGLALVQPWDWPAPGQTQAMPHAELAAYRNLSQRLSGRRIAGSLPVRNATCYILTPADNAPPGRTGALIAWQTTPGPEPAALDAFLGDGAITLVDLFGNSRPLPATAVQASTDVGPAPSPAARPQRTHHITLTDEPVFVEGVDVDLALFASSFAVDPPRLPPSAAEHDLALTLSNPWPTPIEGRISILEPGGLSMDPSKRDRTWRISPRSTTFSIAPGQSARIPLTVAFSAVEESGPKEFVAQVDLAGTRDYGPIRLRTTLEVGLESSPLDLSYQISGQDLIVEAQATNRGAAPATFEVSAFAPGFARQKASISDLAPGASATRRFAFPAGLTKLRNQRITVGMQDLETKSRINRSIPIE